MRSHPRPGRTCTPARLVLLRLIRCAWNTTASLSVLISAVASLCISCCAPCAAQHGPSRLTGRPPHCIVFTRPQRAQIPHTLYRIRVCSLPWSRHRRPMHGGRKGPETCGRSEGHRSPAATVSGRPATKRTQSRLHLRGGSFIKFIVSSASFYPRRRQPKGCHYGTSEWPLGPLFWMGPRLPARRGYDAGLIAVKIVLDAGWGGMSLLFFIAARGEGGFCRDHRLKMTVKIRLVPGSGERHRSTGFLDRRPQTLSL